MTRKCNEMKKLKHTAKESENKRIRKLINNF